MPETDNSKIFDRHILRMRRNRAAADWEKHNFLVQEAAARLADSLADIKRTFPLTLELGCHKGELASVIGNQTHIVQCDIAEKMRPDIVCDEELLCFTPNTFDMVASVLNLHHVNDLPGTFVQIMDILKPDGLFIAVIPGANTLIELRNSVINVAAERGFPLSPRVSPFVEVRDAGMLLQRAGFALPVIDSDTITVGYNDAYEIMKDIQGMGESNIMIERLRSITPHQHLTAIVEYYQSHYPSEEGGVNATFEFITVTGWKPHESQQQPAERGSGEVNLNQALR